MYKLIWQRFVASQMTPAVFDQTTIDISAGDYLLRATGSVEKFNGFRAVYEEGKDEKAEMEEDEELKLRLPQVEQGERLKLRKILPEQHFTEPPPRFNEATLVKALEEKGIGRPSTYATILSTIQNREYVEKLQGRFYPTELGHGGERSVGEELQRHLRGGLHRPHGRRAGRSRRRETHLDGSSRMSSTRSSRKICG